MKGSPSEWRRKDQMMPESQNKLLARRFMEEAVTAGGIAFRSSWRRSCEAPHLGTGAGQKLPFLQSVVSSELTCAQLGLQVPCIDALPWKMTVVETTNHEQQGGPSIIVSQQ